MEEQEIWLPIQEAAVRYGLDYFQLHKWYRSGHIRGRKVAGRIEIAETSLAGFLPPAGTVDLEALVEFMMQTATVAKPDVLGVLEGFFNAVEYMLLDGKFVCTPIAVFRPAVQGLFVDEQDSFDPSRHTIRATASAGVRLRRAMRLRAQANKVHSVAPVPAPKRFCDVASGEANGTLTPGGQGRVLGLRLAFDPADPQQGVFFLAADGTAHRAGRPARNMPGEVILVVPALPAGVYTLEVRAAFNGDGELRTGKLRDALTVG